MANTDDYMRMLNQHAFNRINTGYHKPKENLGIETDENLKSYPVAIYADVYANQSNVIMQDNRKIPVEEVGLVGSGVTVTEDDFHSGNGVWLGSPIGGY